MKKILTFVMFVILFNLPNVYAYEMTYQGASNKTYVVGSGANDVGVNTGSSNDMRNIQFIFLYKGDIIRYIPDTMNLNVSTTGKTYTLGAGFTFSDNNQDVTPDYARIISTYEGGTFGNTGLPIYQEVEITSDYPIVLYIGGSSPTSQGTIHTDDNKNSWYYRSQTWSISPYQVDHNLTWNLNDGIIYGETELPNKYYFSDTDYTITLASPPVKKSSHFTGWTFSTSLAKLSQVSPTVIKESAIKFNNNSSQGIVNALNNTNYDVVATANFSPGKTLEFKINGGTLEGISDNYIVEIPNNNKLLGNVINAYTPSKSNSTFVGWYSDSELTEKIDDDTELDCSSSNVEVYAKWIDNGESDNLETEKYAVTDSNGNIISFTEEKEREFTLNIIDYLTFSDEDLEAAEIPKEIYDSTIEAIANATKNYGTLLSFYEIEVRNDDGYLIHDGPFNIKIKMTDEMKKYNTFRIIYVDADNNFVIESPIALTQDGEYLVGTLDHLSTYALTGSNTSTSNNSNTTNNPQTGDNVVFYVLMLGLSIIGLAGAGIYTKKKLFNK